MKKIILGLAVIASLSSVAIAKITVSQQPIVQPHYEGCVLVYQYGMDFSKCSSKEIYQLAFQKGYCHYLGTC